MPDPSSRSSSSPSSPSSPSDSPGAATGTDPDPSTAPATGPAPGPSSGHWSGAPTASIEIAATQAAVYACVADPTTYPSWLPGADRVRSVDASWPDPGSAFHHVVGWGPLKVADTTEVLAVDAPTRLDLRARLGPFGAADVRFDLTDVGRVGEGAATRVDVYEKPQEGVLAVAWKTLGRFQLRVGLWGRNELALRRLKRYCEEGDGA